MGTQLYGACVKEADIEIPSIPPGFESFPSFTLKRVEDSKSTVTCSVSTSASESQSVHNETEPDISDAAKMTRSLRRRPLINYGRLGDSNEDGSDLQQLQNLSIRPCLPKGVIRGCPECSNCQKVSARWRPEDACRPDLEDAPVFYPNEEEFEDTLTYIERIRPLAEPYGICRIVPPPSWKPPCPLKEKSRYEGLKFATRVQKIDKLQNRYSLRKMLKNNNSTRRKRRRCSRMGVECGTSSGNFLDPSDAGLNEGETFGFEPGPELTMATFENYADNFKAQYFSKTENVAEMVGNDTTMVHEHWEPSVENIEGEYWRMVEKPTEEIEVLYGADLETGSFGSGFPKMSSQGCSDSDEKYIKSGWNLNNFPRLQGSVLSYESSDISGVLVPWLYIGMCFSSFCWHVEDHHLYSLNYMHWGASKIWYGVPENDAVKLEAAMRKYLPDLFEEQPDLLHKLVTQLSPSILKSEGIPVYRCVQNPQDFVLTFPRAYHSGFNCGFNCAEAVNVAPVDWLPHGQNAIELYREQGRKTSISHDKLLLGAAREAVKAHWELNLLKKNTPANLRWKAVCGKDGILARALKTRVEMEHTRRDFFCNSMQAVKMESSFDATNERECSVCFFDLHLSAAGCYRCQDRYACLNHAKLFCSCASNAKFFLFRYDISELNILVEALEGKLSSVYRWARLDLGLSLSSYVHKGKLLSPGFPGKLSQASEETILEEVNSRPLINVKYQRVKEITKDVPVVSIGHLSATSSLQQEKSPEALAASKHMEVLSSWHRSLHPIKMETNSSQIKKEVGTSICQISLKDSPYPGNSVVKEEPGEKKSLGSGYDNVILLSDDEGEEPTKPVPIRAEEKSCAKPSEPSERQKISDDKASPCNYNTDPVLNTPLNDATVISQVDIRSSHSVERSNCSIPVCVKDECHGKDVPLGSNQPNIFCQVGSKSVEFGKHLHNLSAIKEASDHSLANSGSSLQHPQTCDGAKPDHDDKNENMRISANSTLGNNVITITGNQLCTQNNLDRYYRQKGPRIAKVVRRINCNVEPLEFGVVLSGKLWCNSQAIFPKGFRSRVRYMSVLDPTNMSYYVSEILDAGRDGPLFMVSLEDCPNEVFIHVSATRCWDMVRERVNQEIAKHHKSGRANLPPLQPPGGPDGFEMFGFSSPAIVQAIEAMDQSRVCTEYWDSRPYSRPQIQIPQSRDNKVSIQKMSDRPNDQKTSGPVEGNTMLGGLLKKANLEELQSLYSILSNNRSTSDQGLLTLLQEEILTRPRHR